MQAALKRNALIILGLAALFNWSFMFAKHNPALRDVIPFGDDPYDAVGSFATLTIIVIALISLVRAFRPYGKVPPSRMQCIYLIRTQAAAVFIVLITIGSDTVAMARHPAMWINGSARNELIILLAAVGAAAVAVLMLIRASRDTASGGGRWRYAVMIVLLASLVLFFYPEQLINRFTGHMLTVLVGDIVLFAPIRSLLTAFVPHEYSKVPAEATPARGRILSPWMRWGIVLLLGVCIGVFVFAGEMSEGGPMPPLGRLVLVASVFLSLAIGGFLIAYAFLGRPLGLAPRK